MTEVSKLSYHTK